MCVHCVTRKLPETLTFPGLNSVSQLEKNMYTNSVVLVDRKGDINVQALYRGDNLKL